MKKTMIKTISIYLIITLKLHAGEVSAIHYGTSKKIRVQDILNIVTDKDKSLVYLETKTNEIIYPEEIHKITIPMKAKASWSEQMKGMMIIKAIEGDGSGGG